VRLPAAVCAAIRRQLFDEPGTTLTVDLPTQRVFDATGATHPFEIDPFRKECLLQGVDDIQLSLGRLDDIHDWERRQWQQRPWAALQLD
jgi:3-isopropylmalate/(R)-2-methylmalate dehydratase small subunit